MCIYYIVGHIFNVMTKLNEVHEAILTTHRLFDKLHASCVFSGLLVYRALARPK